MPYWNTPNNAPVNIDSNTLLNSSSPRRIEFYEIEPAVVLDVILDKNHPYFANKGSPQHTLNPTQWPPDLNGLPAKPKDLDYSWIGRVLVRLYYSQQSVEKEDLVWAIPLESNISEYPLLNEIVGIISYLGRYYYTRKVNLFNTPNSNANFAIEPSIGGYNPSSNSPIQGNRELVLDGDSKTDSYKAFQGPTSKTSPKGGQGFEGTLGRYFLINPHIRSIKRREGDLVVESRFGQSIRFGAYDDDRNNDIGKNSGFSGYEDYIGDGTTYTINNTVFKQGGGNPMILIRNRQRPLADAGKDSKPYENIPATKGTEEEKNVGGYIVEDVNNDGSSIHMTSGITPTGFKTNCSKKMFGQGEEQSAFEPGGSTEFKYPSPAIGDQIVMNSDRIIISAKKNEMFQFSKKRMSFVTDGEYTVDAHDQIVFTTNVKTVLNSPAIYLGEYDETEEPVLLGKTTVKWLQALCQWLLTHNHWHIHKHPDAGKAEPDKTQLPVQTEKLKQLRDTLDSLLSRRVFVTGGGYAPGADGKEI